MVYKTFLCSEYVDISDTAGGEKEYTQMQSVMRFTQQQ